MDAWFCFLDYTMLSCLGSLHLVWVMSSGGGEKSCAETSAMESRICAYIELMMPILTGLRNVSNSVSVILG